MIRPAHPADFAALQEIERAAGQAFAAIGMSAVAEDDPFTDTELATFTDAGNAWVWDDAGRVAAYAVVLWVDGLLHLEQVSVHPHYAGRRIGAALIDHLAATYDTTALTLTTFTDVAWNAPYYERLGFHRLPAAEETPGLRRLRADEAAHGLDRWPRTCMRRNLH